MAAKCNITKFVLEDLNTFNYGFNCVDNSCAIIENYVEYLNCPSVIQEICHPDNCENKPIFFECTFNIKKISSRVIENNTIEFFIEDENLINGVSPYQYSWVYEEEDFELINNTTSNTLILQPKENKDLSVIVSRIQVSIICDNGCMSTKVCWLTPQGMECGNMYEPCDNPHALEVVPNYIHCPSCKTLIIT